MTTSQTAPVITLPAGDNITANDVGRRPGVVDLLNRRLASAVDLQMQVKQARWNVKSPDSIEMHDLFDRVDSTVAEYVEKIAERIVQLGGIALGTVRVSALRSRLKEYPLAIAEEKLHVIAVGAALAAFGHEVRGSVTEARNLNDSETLALLTEVSQGIDKSQWLVEAHSRGAGCGAR